MGRPRPAVGARIRIVWTLFRALGSAKENICALEFLKGHIVLGCWELKRKLRVNVFGIGTGCFNQNAKGLNLTWLAENRRQANPDALPYNEYQKTTRFSGGVTGDWTASDNQHLAFNFFSRPTNYTESVPSSVLHRSLRPLEGSVQYNFDHAGATIRNYLGVGFDVGGQFIDATAYPNLGNAVEGPNLVANGDITQSHVGSYVMDRVSFGPK